MNPGFGPLIRNHKEMKFIDGPFHFSFDEALEETTKEWRMALISFIWVQFLKLIPCLSNPSQVSSLPDHRKPVLGHLTVPSSLAAGRLERIAGLLGIKS